MSIYDNLANSDFVNPGQFKEQLKQMAEMQTSKDSAAGEENKGMEIKNSDIDLPGPRYELPEDSVQSSLEVFDKNAESVQRSHNPMDSVENEQSLRPKPDMDFEAIKRRYLAEVDEKSTGLDPKLGSESFAPLSRAELQAQISKRDLIEIPDSTRNQDKLDRNRMLFDDGELDTLASHKPRIDEAAQQFTLNKNSLPTASQPGTIQTQPSARESDDQAHTAHFQKNSVSASGLKEEPTQRAVTQETQRDSRHGSRPDDFGEGALIEQHAMRHAFDNDDYEDSEQKRRAEKVRALMARQVAPRDEDEKTGQFGGGKDTLNADKAQSRLDKSAEKARQVNAVQIDQFRAEEMKKEELEASPMPIKSRLDADNEKISAILAQLQAPMDVKESKGPQDLERVHKHMQDSIKQMRLSENPHGLSVQQQNSETAGRAFNGQNSLYDLANKAGHPTHASASDGASVNEGTQPFQASMGSATYNARLDQMLSAGAEQQRFRDDQPSQTSELIAQLNYRNFVGASPAEGSLAAMDLSGTDSRRFFQETGQQVVREKENFNERNFSRQQPTLQEYVQQVQQPAQQRPMSLAQRAQQSKLQNLKAKMANAPEHQRTAPHVRNPTEYPTSPHVGGAIPQRPSLPQSTSARSQAVDFSQTDKVEKAEKRKQLLAHFDDIPIHQLHKADGYQVRNLEEEANMQAQTSPQTQDPNMSLKDQCFHKNWKVRSRAFKEINQLMLDYNPAERETQTKEDLVYGEYNNPFDTYGPIIDAMIKDSNLTAQYDGYTCLLTYVRLNQGDIKSVVSTTCSLMLDKLQIAKPNFREIAGQILQMMLQRRQNIVAEMLKRFKSVNPKMSSFCFEALIRAFETRSLHLQDANLRLMFKFTHDMLAHGSRELRDLAHALMAHIYENCEDDLGVFCANVKSLRPIQLKELRDTLAEHQKKTADYQVRLFTGDAATQPEEKGEEERSRSREPPARDGSMLGGKMHAADAGEDAVDLCSVLPENFSELSRISQIKQKQRGMESFNHELEKLRNKEDIQIKFKDYSNIFHVTASLLEDPNVLVFIEAIKTVEHLAALLKGHLKKEKSKQFLLVLADKYKETKTAVITALSTVFEVMFNSRCVSPALFFDILVNQIAAVHKNPRVRQMVLERVAILMQGQNDQGLSPKILQSVLKATKDKLAQIVVKDTVAVVRDQAAVVVTLVMTQMTKAKAHGKNPEEAEVVLAMAGELMDQLPARRQGEIRRKVEELTQGAPSITIEPPPETDRSERPPRAISAARKRSIASQNRGHRNSDLTEDDPLKASIASDAPFLPKKGTAQVSDRYQASLSDVVLTIKNIGQDQDRLRLSQIEQNLEAALADLSDEGIKECKQQIVSCFYALLTHYPGKVNFLNEERQESVKAVLTFVKRLYLADRSISLKQMQDGDPLELVHAFSAVQLCFALLSQDPHSAAALGQLLDVVLSAVVHTPMPLSRAVGILKRHIAGLEPSFTGQVPHAKAILVSHTIYFLADKVEDLIGVSRKQVADGSATEAVELSDFEEVRNITISLLERGMFPDEQTQQVVVQALYYLRDRMTSLMQVPPASEEKQGASPALAEDRQLRSVDALYRVVVEQLETNFERGLLLLKDLVRDEQSGVIPPLKYEHRESLFKTLLNFITIGNATPADQYKQAYSLKALMWLREEAIGLEDAFKMSSSVMAAYSIAVVEERDSSIEGYLLSNWTSGLSLRDLADRVGFTVLEQGPSNLAPLLHWLQIKFEADESWRLEDVRKLALVVAHGAVGKNEESRQAVMKFLDTAVDRFAAGKLKQFMETQLLHENQLLMKFVDFFDAKYGFALRQEEADSAQHVKIADSNAPGRGTDEILQEPLLTGRSGAVSAQHSRFQELREKRKASVDRTNDDFDQTLAEEKRKYDQIMQKLDGFKRGGDTASVTEEEDKTDRLGRNSGLGDIALQRRVSASQKGRDGERPISGRYGGDKAGSGMGYASQKECPTMSQFNDDEDFRLSTEHQNSIAHLAGMQSQKSSVQNLNSRRGLHTATVTDEDEPVDPTLLNRQSSAGQHAQQEPALGDGLRSHKDLPASGTPGPQEIGERTLDSQLKGSSEAQLKMEHLNNEPNEQLQSSRQKIKDSVADQEEKMQRLESSHIKMRMHRQEVDSLGQEKRRLESEMQRLLAEQNRESEEWRRRHDEIAAKNQDIVTSLADANEQYMNQVSENERLADQLKDMQQQHREFLTRYRDLEQALADSRKQVEVQKQQLVEESLRNEQLTSHASKFGDIVPEQQMLMVEQVFEKGQATPISVKKVQEMLLDAENAQISKPLVAHYQRLRASDERMGMLAALRDSIDNEDILFAISVDSYKSLLNFLLRAFSFEKELIERESLTPDTERETKNELTQEAQRLISKLLNSKEFTTSLICLVQLLKIEAMPSDFSVRLSISERHYLRVIMRCISRITKALHSESPDLVRAFDVLFEMQKMFVKHPPENLKQDLPCLADFDFVYRGLKDVSDKMIELQPQKCRAFLEFCNKEVTASQGQRTVNAFIKYLNNVLEQ